MTDRLYCCFSAGKLKFDKMAVEKWPIVQAFALEGFGGYVLYGLYFIK